MKTLLQQHYGAKLMEIKPDAPSASVPDDALDDTLWNTNENPMEID